MLRMDLENTLDKSVECLNTVFKGFNFLLLRVNYSDSFKILKAILK